MKHSLRMTVILLVIFLLAQFIGLGIIYKYIDFNQSTEEETVFKDLPIGERPPLEEKTSFLPVILTILIGTVLLLFIIKRNLIWIWRIWFLMAVTICLTTVLSIFIPVFSLFSVSILLILIALYDAYAVWKSKHMITLAKSQAESKVFAGFLLPYKIPKAKPLIKTKPVKVRTAVLGGGDIGFPLIFAGVIMKEMGVWQSLVIPIFASLGLIYLLWKGDQNKFYPAMPFIGAGCFLGLGLVWLIG